MNHKVQYTIIVAVFTMILAIEVHGEYRSDVISVLQPTDKDIPTGFMYGKVPPAARTVFKQNPGLLDNPTIQRIAKYVYPEGDYRNIASMHVSIIADEKTPYGDDIVCYVILYKGGKSAEREIKKLNEFAQYNSDRVIVIARENLAVFLLVDSIDNFHHIRTMADAMEVKIDEIDSKTQCAVLKQ